MNNHLNDQQLFSLLDNPNAAVETHLAACVPCRDAFNQLRGSLSNFRATATSFAAAQAPARLSTRLLHFQAAPKTRWMNLPPAAWATGLIAAMAIGTASLSILHKAPIAGETISHIQVTPVQKASSSDDALLEDIDRDLSTSVPPSLAPLETTTTGEKTTNSN
jgi:predicted anti-sigma-YlaC factor YlaD